MGQSQICHHASHPVPGQKNPEEGLGQRSPGQANLASSMTPTATKLQGARWQRENF